MTKFIKLYTDIPPLQASSSLYFVQFAAVNNANMSYVGCKITLLLPEICTWFSV
jgi:hypothetical protein